MYSTCVHSTCLATVRWLLVLLIPPILTLPNSMAQVDDGTGNEPQASAVQTLEGTRPLLDLPSDPAAAMVAGIDRFALRQIDKAESQREQYWQGNQNTSTNRDFLIARLGIRSPSLTTAASQATITTAADWLVERPVVWQNEQLTIEAIRWPVRSHPAPQLTHTTSLWGEGLLLQPLHTQNQLAIVIPDADEMPEDYTGLVAAPPTNRAGPTFVHELICHGYTVIIPQLISRDTLQHGHAQLSKREYLHRAAFELGHSLVGYEVASLQGLLAAYPQEKSIVAGFGEGGMLALYCGAIDERVESTVCCGYFGPRESMWAGPLSRNLFGVLERMGDAELASMIAPRKLIICPVPSMEVVQSTPGGAPSQWKSPSQEDAASEFSKLQGFAAQILHEDPQFAQWIDAPQQADLPIAPILTALELTDAVDRLPLIEPLPEPQAASLSEHAAKRALRLLNTIDAHTQAVLAEAEYGRSKFMNIGLPRDNAADGSNVVDTTTAKSFQESTQRFREIFIDEVIGKFDEPLKAANPQSRKNYEGKGWTGYDVMLDVFDDVFAYGVLLLPNDLQPGERRPVVVCQHGLEGRPQDTVQGDHYAYHDFSAQLASRGFIVFAPQNPYIGQDDFRTLQRKMNPLGKTLFSIIGPQHQQILNWLSSLPFVDSERIGFYGLSYGGKSAMRLPAMLPQYCLSICSADFNDWVWKNASSRSPYSYIGTGEYEIFEYNLGHTFNYAEMAALIAPRPFMVERGHYDGVAPDDRVAKEFARVQFLYAARLDLADRCKIEWFNGPHTINGKGTFEFLHKHMHWPIVE